MNNYLDQQVRENQFFIDNQEHKPFRADSFQAASLKGEVVRLRLSAKEREK